MSYLTTFCFSLAQVIILSYSLAIYISYGLQGYVPVQIMWTNYIVKHLEDANAKKKAFYEYLLRIVCVIVTCKLLPTFFFTHVLKALKQTTKVNKEKLSKIAKIQENLQQKKNKELKIKASENKGMDKNTWTKAQTLK